MLLCVLFAALFGASLNGKTKKRPTSILVRCSYLILTPPYIYVTTPSLHARIRTLQDDLTSGRGKLPKKD